MAQARDIRAYSAPRMPQQRLATIAIVAGIHVVVIGGFIVALNPNLVIPKPAKPIDVVIPREEQRQTPLPPPTGVVLRKPTTPTVQPPDVQYDDHSPSNPIASSSNPQGSTSFPSAIFVAARGITATHTIPTYPPAAIRFSEQGNVLLKLSIDETGAVVNASVMRSSGYTDLDDTAVAWVKAHWRYMPATRDGNPVAATSDAIVTFRLTGR